MKFPVEVNVEEDMSRVRRIPLFPHPQTQLELKNKLYHIPIVKATRSLLNRRLK
jgi:hypothetical protein